MPHWPLVAWVAYGIGLVPLAWCALRRERRREYWWLAMAFGISFLADTATLAFGHPWLWSAVYPVGQTAVIGAVFLSREETAALTLLLMGTALVTILALGVNAPSALLHDLAWLAIVGMVWRRPLGQLRWALLVAFGVNIVPWTLLALRPSWTTWELYQGVRAVGVGWFCVAQAA